MIRSFDSAFDQSINRKPPEPIDNSQNSSKTKVLDSRLNNNTHIRLVEEIWQCKIQPFLDLKDTLVLRECSFLTHTIADDFLLHKIPVEQLLLLKENAEKQEKEILPNCPMKLQTLGMPLILEEIARRFNTREMTSSDLPIIKGPYNLPIIFVEELITFFGEKCERIQVLVLDFHWNRKIDLEDLCKIKENFTNLIELEFEPSENLIVPEKMEVFSSVQSLHLWGIHNFDQLNDLLKIFPNITELTCSEITVNVFKCLTNHTSLQRVVLWDKCDMFDFEQEEISVPSITHLSIYDSTIEIFDLCLPSLTQIDFSDVAVNLAFLKKSPKLENVSIQNSLPMPLDFLESCSLVKNLTLSENICSGVTENAFGHLTGLLKFSSIETLTIEGLYIKDFGVLCSHPNLKTLYIIDCTNMDTAKVLEDMGIEVFCENTLKPVNNSFLDNLRTLYPHPHTRPQTNPMLKTCNIG